MKYIEENKNKIIDDLLECLSIASVSNDKEKTEEALDHVLHLAQKMGMKASKLLDGRVGVIEIGEGEETLGILTHIDVVDCGNRDLWITDPYKGQIIGDKIYGRGALDDKGPLIINLHAMKAAMEEERPFYKKVQLIIGTQEETEWSEMDEYVKKYPLPDYGYTPDGEYPICNIEKGYVDAVLQFPIEEEQSGDGVYLTSIKGGTAVNIIPESCQAVLSDGRVITAEGKSAHSSRPQKGENAILKMADELSAMGLKRNPLLEKVEMIGERLSDMFGKSIGLQSKSEYYHGEFIHRNVVSPTVIEVNDDRLKVLLNVRFSYESSEEQVIDAIKAFCEEEGGYLESYDALPAVYVSCKEPYLSKMAKAYESQSGYENSFSLAYGGSYAKTMPRMVAWGPILPGMEDTCHEENEYLRIDDLVTNFNIYYNAILNIAKCEESLLATN